MLGVISQIRVKTKRHEPEIIELVTNNICAGGAYFKTANPLPVGTKISLKMTVELNNKEKSQKKNMVSIEICGIVIRADEEGMAVQFENGYTMLPVSKKS